MEPLGDRILIKPEEEKNVSSIDLLSLSLSHINMACILDLSSERPISSVPECLNPKPETLRSIRPDKMSAFL